MSYAVSLLEKSPIPSGASARQALLATVALAQRAEALGYRRFWVAEHHGNPGYAGSAPELLVAHLLAHTRHIRIGTGGVMLQHYSPFKVAEVFHVLEALAPGRVDLGIGKAPGGLPACSRALQSRHDTGRKASFEELLVELQGHLSGQLPADHPLHGAQVTPVVPSLPQRFLLGASAQSAELAARLDWEFSYAGHFNEDPAQLEQSFDIYRKATGRSPSLALYASIAETREKAEQQVAAVRIHHLKVPGGQGVNLPTAAAALEYARQIGVQNPQIEERRPHVLTGTPQQVRDALDVLSERWGVEEFVIDLPVPEFAARLQSIEGLARAIKAEPVAA